MVKTTLHELGAKREDMKLSLKVYHFQELSRSSIRDAILERDGRYVMLERKHMLEGVSPAWEPLLSRIHHAPVDAPPRPYHRELQTCAAALSLKARRRRKGPYMVDLYVPVEAHVPHEGTFPANLFTVSALAVHLLAEAEFCPLSGELLGPTRLRRRHLLHMECQHVGLRRKEWLSRPDTEAPQPLYFSPGSNRIASALVGLQQVSQMQRMQVEQFIREREMMRSIAWNPREVLTKHPMHPPRATGYGMRLLATVFFPLRASAFLDWLWTPEEFQLDPVPLMTPELFPEEYQEEMTWGTYRPGIYFGVKGRHEKSFLFGLMWGSLDGKLLRHECESGQLRAFNWQEHDSCFNWDEDGRNYGFQRIEDEKLGHELKTIFVKEDSKKWHVRINTTTLGASAKAIVLFPYLGIEATSRLQVDEDSDWRQDSQSRRAKEQGKLHHVSAYIQPDEADASQSTGVWDAKRNLQKFLSKTKRPRLPDSDETGTANWMAFQLASNTSLQVDFHVDFRVSRRILDANAESRLLEDAMKSKSEDFKTQMSEVFERDRTQRFKSEFNELNDGRTSGSKGKADEADEAPSELERREALHLAVASLLGGLGVFRGRLLVKTSETSLQRLPKKDPDIANPPSLLLPLVWLLDADDELVESLARQSKMSSTDFKHLVLSFSEKAFPRLTRWTLESLCGKLNLTSQKWSTRVAKLNQTLFEVFFQGEILADFIGRQPVSKVGTKTTILVTPPWRSDGRCGPQFPAEAGTPGECDPYGGAACCSPSGCRGSHKAGELWSRYGVLSLSSKDPLFRSGEDYWRGKIWANLNYLTISALQRCEKGRGAAPFAGWTSLVALLAESHSVKRQEAASEVTALRRFRAKANASPKRRDDSEFDRWSDDEVGIEESEVKDSPKKKLRDFDAWSDSGEDVVEVEPEEPKEQTTGALGPQPPKARKRDVDDTDFIAYRMRSAPFVQTPSVGMIQQVLLVPVAPWSCFLCIHHGVERLRLFATLLGGDATIAQVLVQAAKGQFKLSHRSHFEDVKKEAAETT
eukprot:g30685.t1